MNDRDRHFYEELGQRISKLRKAQSMTQVQLASVLGISQQHMASYEHGKRKIPSAALPMLVRHFAISAEELLGLGQMSLKRGRVAKLQKQIEQVGRLPRSKQRFVSEFLETVIQQ